MLFKVLTALVFASLSTFIGVGQTPRINFEAPYAYPEGVAFNSKTNSFFVSSARTGTIGVVDGAGTYSKFYEDQSLKSSFGMKVYLRTSRLWVCTGDPNYSIYRDSSTYKKMVRLIAIDLVTRKKVADIDLSTLYSGKHFANDLAMDVAGNIYITDSYSPVIYKVDTKGVATIFAQNDLFKGIGIGINGIVYHTDGFLLVDNDATGSLLKVMISNPSQVTKVRVDQFFPGADGLLWDDKQNLILIQNKGVNAAYQLSSSDKWASAQIRAATAAEDRFQNPSTGALKGTKIYLLNAKLNELSDPTVPLSKEFSLQLVQFRPVQ